jgi:RNA polymerase sigma factor (sigma-70 family)
MGRSQANRADNPPPSVVAAARAGDAAAKETLAASFVPVVAELVGAAGPDAAAAEDLAQDAWLALFSALRRCAPGKETTFRAYAIWWMQRAVRDGSGRYAVPETAPPRRFDEVVAELDGEVETLADALPDPRSGDEEERILERSAAKEWCRILNLLSSRDREMLAARFGIGGGKPASQRELAARLGVSGQRIGQLEDRAVAMLRRAAAQLAEREAIA